MIAVYGSLIAILLCLFLPPLFDHFMRKNGEWSWKKALGGYALMTGLGCVAPVLLGVSLYVNWLFVILAVAIATIIAPVTFLGTSFVLVLLNIILPMLILWDMSKYNKVKEPTKLILDNTDWPEFLAPLVLGLVTFYVGWRLRQRFRRNEKHPTPA